MTNSVQIDSARDLEANRFTANRNQAERLTPAQRLTGVSGRAWVIGACAGFIAGALVYAIHQMCEPLQDSDNGIKCLVSLSDAMTAGAFGGHNRRWNA